MKKFFLGALAIAGLVACVQTEEVGVLNPADGQIAFGGYVGNQSRAAVDNSTDISELNHFTVWGYMDMSVGQIFNDELVTKDSAGAWTYDGTQYWAAGHDYRFFAITPYGNGNSHVVISTPSTDPYNDGLGTITFTNEEGKEDVLYASKTESTKTAIPEKVTFQFNHLLSKVKFTFTNGYDGEFATIAVKNVTMEVPYKGTVTLDESVKTQYTWENLEGTKTLAFGDVEGGAQLDLGDVKEADQELLTIPADEKQTYKVTFDVIVYQGEGTQVSTTHHFESIIADKALVAGTSYNFTATIDADALNAKAIVFDAKVDEWEKDGDTPLDPIAGTVVRVATIDELQTALNTTVENYPYHILITKDLEGVVVAPEVADQKVTIDGQGHTLKGAIQINGKTAYAGATTVIKNIDFVAEAAATLVDGNSFIYCGELNKNTNVRYPDNIIVENCTFTATGAAEKAAVAVKVWALDHGQLVIKGSKADGVHSLMQVTSSAGANVLVDGVEIVNAKNGISLDNAGKTVIKNSTISTAEYGIRANSDRNAANTTIEATTITAKQPIVVRKVTKAGYALTLGAGVVLNTEEPFQVIFTKGSDDAAYVAPEVEFTYSSAVEFAVYPAVKGLAYNVATAEDLADVLAAGATNVVLADNVNYGTITVAELKDVTINGGENTAVQLVTTATSVIENVTVKDVDYSFSAGAGQAGAFVVINKDAQIENLVIEGCAIVGDGNKGSYGITGQNPNATVVVKNCNFSNLGYAIQTIAGGGYKSLVVEGCIFESIKSWSIMPQYGYTGDLTVNGCTFANCDGLVKTGAFGGLFTFTNNTLTNTNGHDGKDSKCFEVNANGTAVVAGNTKDGVEWIPASAQGLK